MPTYMPGLRVFRATELWTGVLPIHTFPTRPGCPTLLPPLEMARRASFYFRVHVSRRAATPLPQFRIL